MAATDWKGSLDGTKKHRRRSYASIAGVMLADVFLINVALMASIGLAHNFRYPFGTPGFLLRFALPMTLVAVPLLFWRRLYRINSRFLGFFDFFNIALVGTLLAATLSVIVNVAGVKYVSISSWTAPLLFALLSSTLLALARVYQRMIAARAVISARIGRGRSRRILIVGAGDLGDALFRELSRSDEGACQVVGFIDDDPRLHGTTIHGVSVLGGVDRVAALADQHLVEEILIALPEASEDEMRRVFHACIATQARVRSLPPLSRFVRSGSHVLPMMREVSVDELLKRASVKSEMTPTARYLSGERVLITGGGGSIGSELARQVSSLTPASLILMGKGENSVFEIDQELRQHNVFHPTPIICDIRDRQAVRRIFDLHKPTVVFHAAAHKHVPLMEAVPIEAIQNNVFGTLNIAEIAIQSGVQKLILVSTDKAVRPSNVMGATKRVAEMIFSALSTRTETSFSAVRFGNVLGSRGSLIPILKRQIASGGPVTLTHPEMTRFFMTIPEAVQLIVQAGAMGEKGEVFILDMGDPVSIVELAKDMIRLHGLVPGQDIEMKFTGIRPGEKIHEELAHSSDDLLDSAHEKIRVVKPQKQIDWEWLRAQLDTLQQLCASGDEQAAKAFLMELAWEKTMPPIGATAVVWEEDSRVEAAED